MPGSIPPAFIREIVDITDIVALVDSYVPLKKKGKDHWGLCPFCDDGSNPSFSVSSQKQFYYCFKCRATGNVIGFLESFEGLGFVESVEALASRAALEIPYEKSSRKQEDREPLFKVLASASSFFEDCSYGTSRDARAANLSTDSTKSKPSYDSRKVITLPVALHLKQ